MKSIAVVLMAGMSILSLATILRAQTAKDESAGGKSTFATKDQNGGAATAQSESDAQNGSSKSTASSSKGGNQWRYRWHNGQWWYWTESNRWVYWSGGRWVPYGAVVHSVGMRPYVGTQSRYLPGMQTGAAYGSGGNFGGNQPTHYTDSGQGGNYEPNAGHSSGFTWGDTGRGRGSIGTP